MKRKYLFLAVIIAIAALVGFFFISNKQNNMDNSLSIDTIRYVPLGDSYTSGEGVSENERWPNVLVSLLQEKGVKIELVANPAVSGFTTEDVIERELSVFENANPSFATLLIGANDLALGVDETTYRENLQSILDRMQKALPEKDNILLITIPDFSKTPRGKQFGDEQFLIEKITRFNTILKEEGDKRNLTTVDIFSVSQNVESDPSLIVPDGLHPSAKQYAQWVEIIFPKVLEMVKKYE